MSPVGTQGQLSVAFFQVSALMILLVLYLILNKDLKVRFLRLWIAGWTLLTCSAVIRLVEQVYETRLEWAIVQTGYFVAVTLMLAAVMEFIRPSRALRSVWLWGILAGAVCAGTSFQGENAVFIWRWVPAIFVSATSTSAGFMLWRTRKRTKGHGITLMASALLLAGLHHLDRPFWSAQQFYSLRMAF